MPMTHAPEIAAIGLNYRHEKLAPETGDFWSRFQRVTRPRTAVTQVLAFCFDSSLELLSFCTCCCLTVYFYSAIKVSD